MLRFAYMRRKVPHSKNSLLRKLRVEDKGWTKEKLARSAGVSAQTVRKAEQGISISEVSMARIAKALGASVPRLFPGSEP